MSPLGRRGGGGDGSRDPAHPRSPEDRERARLEREARRAAREGRAPAEWSQETEVPPPDMAPPPQDLPLAEPLPPLPEPSAADVGYDASADVASAPATAPEPPVGEPGDGAHESTAAGPPDLVEAAIDPTEMPLDPPDVPLDPPGVPLEPTSVVREPPAVAHEPADVSDGPPTGVVEPPDADEGPAVWPPPATDRLGRLEARLSGQTPPPPDETVASDPSVPADAPPAPASTPGLPAPNPFALHDDHEDPPVTEPDADAGHDDVDEHDHGATAPRFETLDPPPPRPTPLTGADPADAPVAARRVRFPRGGRGSGGDGGTPDEGRRRRGGGARRILALVGLLIIVAIAFGAYELFQPGHDAGHGRVVVVIPKNSSSHAIGNLLAKDDVVSSGLLFAIRARLSGKASKMRPGRHVLAHDMSYASAITALTKVPPAAKVVNVTLPEGLSIREAAPKVSAAGVKGSYLKATASSSLLHPKFYGAKKGTHSLEGFLFPSTYQLKVGASVTTLIADQVKEFKSELKQVDLTYSHKKHLTVYDVVTIASMIEREAGTPGDRAKIAAVIYNRLHDHIPLGIDATMRFFLNDWTKPLTVSQLHIETPYNTRIHTGLPPTPIGSPGIAALKAAAHPAKVNYLYYVANPDGCGGSVFSSTLAKFNQDSEAYHAAITKNHGKVPTCKKP